MALRISDIPFSPVAQKFWDKLEPTLDSETWILCGSINKNGELIKYVANKLRSHNLKAITPEVVPWYPAIAPAEKVDDVLFYYRAIRHGKGIIIVNGNGGYYGRATSLEIGHCLDMDKEIRFLYPPAQDDLEGLALVLCGRAKVGLP